MEKVVRIFKSFEEADAADAEFYRSLTPEQRMEIFWELLRQLHGDAPPRLERVYRIVKLGEC
jgi:hypothetical protein